MCINNIQLRCVIINICVMNTCWHIPTIEKYVVEGNNIFYKKIMIN